MRLHLRLLPDVAPTLLQVAAGGQRDLALRRPGPDDVAIVSLDAGWNRIELRLHPVMQPGTGSSPGDWLVTALDIRTPQDVLEASGA